MELILRMNRRFPLFPGVSGACTVRRRAVCSRVFGHDLRLRLQDIESDGRLEIVSVDLDLEDSLLQFGQRLGDGEAQTAALGGAGDIAPDEPFCQLFGTDVQRVCGDVLDGKEDLFLRSSVPRT